MAAVGSEAAARPGAGAAGGGTEAGAPPPRPPGRRRSRSLSIIAVVSHGFVELAVRASFLTALSSYGCWLDARISTGTARSAGSALTDAHRS